MLGKDVLKAAMAVCALGRAKPANADNEANLSERYAHRSRDRDRASRSICSTATKVSPCILDDVRFALREEGERFGPRKSPLRHHR